jgi:hypothetical protein
MVMTGWKEEKLVKKGRQKILHRRLVSVGEIFSSAPPEIPSRPPGLQL